MERSQKDQICFTYIIFDRLFESIDNIIIYHCLIYDKKKGQMFKHT